MKYDKSGAPKLPEKKLSTVNWKQIAIPLESYWTNANLSKYKRERKDFKIFRCHGLRIWKKYWIEQDLCAATL